MDRTLVEFALAACLLAAFSGLPVLLFSRRSPKGQFAAVGLMIVACAIGLFAALRGLLTATTSTIVFPGMLPDWGFHLKFDPLAAFFQVPIFLLGAAGAVYGLGYWRQAEHASSARRMSIGYGLLVASMAMVTLAGDGITFLCAWEILALSALFLIGTEDHKPAARQAAWVYFVAAHFSTLVLIALFAVLYSASGSFVLSRLRPEQAGAGLQAVIFLLALTGFGIKAGIVPLHFWLPGAHANAPSHVSALLSGVVLKVGIYGLLRTLTLLPGAPIACGLFTLFLGVASAIFGVVFALGQHDLKRLLAYHSIENIGIILMGLGLAMVGLALGRPEWTILGMGACLLHVWNHSLFKGLLFLAAGSVVHATHTRDLERLGGLAKSMPRTAALFAIGAIAICGLPPLNGFVSELILYLGLFRTATVASAGVSMLALAAPALAMVGALAVACFVKAYGTVFLGTARTPIAARGESPLTMLAPMALLAALCFGIGFFPVWVLPLLNHAVDAWRGSTGTQLASLVPCSFISAMSLLLALLVLAGLAMLRRRRQEMPVQTAGTWDCGYALSSPRIQYTSSSFANTLVGLFRWLLRPKTEHTAPSGLFPGRSVYESHVPEIVLDGWLNPLWRRVKSFLPAARVLQQGRVQRYLLYILLALFALLSSLIPLAQLARRLLGH